MPTPLSFTLNVFPLSPLLQRGHFINGLQELLCGVILKSTNCVTTPVSMVFPDTTTDVLNPLYSCTYPGSLCPAGIFTFLDAGIYKNPSARGLSPSESGGKENVWIISLNARSQKFLDDDFSLKGFCKSAITAWRTVIRDVIIVLTLGGLSFDNENDSHLGLMSCANKQKTDTFGL